MHDEISAREWLKFAERDYSISLFLKENYRPLPVENICYGCQQSVEKALKAVLIYHTGDAPKIHDINLLTKMCQDYTDEITLDSSVAKTLTRFATKSRYPDEVYDFTDDDVELALKYAKLILDDVENVLNPSQE